MPANCDKSVVRSSVTPSAKYCCSGSLLKSLNGSARIDRCGAGTAVADNVEQAAPGAVFGQYALQQFFAAEPRDFHFQEWIFGLKGIGKKFALGGSHGGVKTHRAFLASEVERFLVGSLPSG